jgi:circadian clock protein KaiC
MHLATMQRLILKSNPSAVIIDPVTNLNAVGSEGDVNAMLVRLVDLLKNKGITGLFVSLNTGGSYHESTEIGMSSLMDTWLLVRDIELGGERNRGMYVLKSRGMNHSNQIREFLITSKGIQLQDVYLGPEGVLTGSMRLAQQERERDAQAQAREELERRRALAEQRRKALQAQILALQAEIETEESELVRTELMEQRRLERLASARDQMALSRSKSTRSNGRESGSGETK